jgi:heme-degrading monooxygenase HmoA
MNVARFRLPKEHHANADFMAALDHVNKQAEASDGFIWRLIGDGNDATDIEVVPGDPDFIVNMSVWRDVAALAAFVYRQADHRAVLARKGDWFESMSPSFVLWPVTDGHRPTVDEGMAKLRQLETEGPGAEAFTFTWFRENG